jgi:hypothetical protein
MERSTLLQQVSVKLGTRRLVWFGTRGDDVESIADLPQFSAAFTIINRYSRRHSVTGVAMEDFSGVRVDLDAYDIDDEPDHEAFAEFREQALRALARDSAAFTYRPSTLVSSICFARRDRCDYIGMFKDHQSAFEHKPWVESALSDRGIAGIPWKYVADEEQLDLERSVAGGPLMLRRSRTSGGTGLVKVTTPEEMAVHWPHEREAFVSVAPYLDGGIPLNVGGVVWHDGVTVHPASIQLIGIEGCTTRPFGYCGNDFSSVHDLDRSVLDDVDHGTHSVGQWLRENGYRGSFGVDFLVVQGRALFTEVNPRFQGSTHLSSEISTREGQGCIVLEHLAACLGIDAPTPMPLREIGRGGGSHIVLHAPGPGRSRIDGLDLASKLSERPDVRRIDVLTRPDLVTDPGATVARVTVAGSVTTTGFDLFSPWTEMVKDVATG